MLNNNRPKKLQTLAIKKKKIKCVRTVKLIFQFRSVCLVKYRGRESIFHTLTVGGKMFTFGSCNCRTGVSTSFFWVGGISVVLL